jgi:hypothetical protein
MANRAIPVRYKVTGKIYPSEVAAGRELGPTLAPDAKQNNFVWYPMHRANPHDFQRMVDGDWVDYPPATMADELRAKRDALLPQPPGPRNGDELQKFSLTRRTQRGTLLGVEHYLVEAHDRAEAEQVIEEEWPESENFLSGEQIALQWSTHKSPEWRIAWRHGKVKLLRPTKVPDGIQ